MDTVGADRLDDLEHVLALLERPAWHARAACRGAGTAAWFPERGQPMHVARSTCARCPVAEQCLAAGMSEHRGVWGGLSERGRRKLRRATDVRAA